jgi:DNA repair protein RadC
MSHRSSERYQLAFDFGQGRETEGSLVYEVFPGTLKNLDSREPEIGRFVHPVSETLLLQRPQQAAAYLLQHVFSASTPVNQEEFWTLMFNAKLRLTHVALVYRGVVDQMRIRPAEVYRDAVRVGAVGLIVSHCHPSGDPTPSPEDISTTRTLVNAGRLLEIDLIDHIVVGGERWVSLRESRLGFDAP